MVLGYMEMQYHDITVSNQGEFRNFIGISWFRMSLRYSDGGGRPRYENRGLRRGLSIYPKHGLVYTDGFFRTGEPRAAVTPGRPR